MPPSVTEMTGTGNNNYSVSWLLEKSMMTEKPVKQDAINDGYETTFENQYEEDPLDELKNPLIVAFVLVALFMLCYLVLCFNSFLYEMTCCPSKKSKQLNRYKGKLTYPLPWNVTVGIPNREYSCSDLKEANNLKVDDEYCSDSNYDQWDDQIDVSVSNTDVSYRDNNAIAHCTFNRDSKQQIEQCGFPAKKETVEITIETE